MFLRSLGIGLFASIMIAVFGGCKRSSSGTVSPKTSVVAAPAFETFARVHWLGKKRLEAETNASSFMSLWKMPESVRLETQTLDKLSRAASASLRAGTTNTAAADAVQTLLRPLLGDLVQEESYLEARRLTNGLAEVVLTVRGEEQIAGRWMSNVAALLESFTGVERLPGGTNGGGWSVKGQDGSNLVQLARAGGWTVLGLAQERSGLFSETVDRIQREQAPMVDRETNFWLEADLDLARIGGVLSLEKTVNVQPPRISLAVLGEGGNVRTRGTMKFADPLHCEIEPWNMPTNLAHDPLVSFTAMRGIGPLLSSLGLWKKSEFGAAPNQLYFWSRGGPLFSFCAAPLTNSSEGVNKLAAWLVDKGNGWLATNGIGRFERTTDFTGVSWNDVPLMAPYVRATGGAQGNFIFGGLGPNTGTNPPPRELLQEVYGRTNLVVYDWEITAPRIQEWIHIGQLLRIMFHRPQLPAASAGMAWIRAVGPRLGDSVTVVSKTEADQLSFTRRSSIGLTAVEMHLLADWLESPAFPEGLHTIVAKPLRRPAVRQGTNAVSGPK